MPLFRNLSAALTFTLLSATQLSAQSAIGFRDAQITVEHSIGEIEAQSSFDAQLDVSITRNHGLQLDLGAASYPDTYYGQIGAHLYMAPEDNAKYGLFASYADANDSSNWIGTIGIEGIWNFGDALSLQARAGMGVLNPDSNDFIFIEGLAQYALSDRFALTGGVAITDLEEGVFAVRSTDLSMGLKYYMPNMPVELSANITRSSLSGSIDEDEILASLLFTVHLGKAKSARSSVHEHFFTNSTPMKTMLRNGIFDY
jgi:hypothetical protein